MPQWNVTGNGPTHPTAPDQPTAKRKAPDDDGDGANSDVMDTDEGKRVKTSTVDDTTHASKNALSPGDAARVAAAFIPFLTSEDLMPPKLPNRDEMEGVLLRLRKQALMSEYFGGGGEA